MASECSSTPQENQGDGGQTDAAGPEAEVPGPAEPGSGETGSAPADDESQGVSVCRFFLRGKCHFGHRCRMSHSDPSADYSETVLPDQDDKDDGGEIKKYNKKKGNVNKATPTRDQAEKEVNKKPRMRTADDVISRILWDPSVDSSEFIVGYVDRFLGVLERPFCEFNWETNPCDCDYSAELALPRHRIQYFTYRGHRIWDRHSRTDRVFGSTGQSLAPPFGGEKEVEEEQPEDPERPSLEQDCLHKREDQPPAVSGQEVSETEACAHTANRHLEEGKKKEMNVCTPDSSQPAPKCMDDASQESRGACVVEEDANSVSTDESPKQGWSKNGDDKKQTSTELEESCKGPDAAEQRVENLGGRPPKKRPTHFITFRANTPAILTGFQQLEEEFTALLPSSAPHFQDSSMLHVTLCLLILPGPAEIATAVEILRRFARFNPNPPLALTFPVKLKHFHGKVLYLSPQPHLQLQHFNSVLQEAYRSEGLLHRDSYNPRYHLTLAKVTDREGERIFEGVADLKVGKGLNFGRLPVNTLHLCAMEYSEEIDFYETVCTVTLR